jgi:multidrug efflux pump
MNFSRFFIDRPIFAGVVSILIFMVGLISMFRLPISQYPEVVPPSIVVAAHYPGANPKVSSETVATPLEEQINGVENMLYMSSQATTDGSVAITVTFKLGTNADLAQQMVQNRVSQALPRLPEEVRDLGVTVVKSSPDLTMVVHLISPKARYDALYLANYAKLNVVDKLARINGVGQVRQFGGGDYAMRIWLDPQKMAERSIAANDVVLAIREQNVQVAAGIIGGPPNSSDLELQLPISAEGRLQTPEQFENIIIKTNSDGGITSLKDIARVEMSAASYSITSTLGKEQAAAMGIFQMVGSNSLQISDNVRKTMDELRKTFPEDIDYTIIYDPTVFVRGSIHAVIHTLLEAIALVVLVVIVFLQTWRASIVPLISVPISIIGTFAAMYAFGFSINALSLFGLVLAIGIVVDDAIVVVENVERNIENGLSPRDATLQAMREVTSPIVATMLVLFAVFIPVAFISGLTGQFYRQFALTIAISVFISTINSLSLSPALAKLLLRSHDTPPDHLTRIMDALFGWFFRLFNEGFKRFTGVYEKIVGFVVRHLKVVVLIVYICLICAAGFLFNITPTGFVPAQDKQYLISFVQLQDGASLDRTDKIVKQMVDIALKEPGVLNAVAFTGMSINGFTPSSSAGIIFFPLKSFEERASKDLSGMAISQKLNQKFSAIHDAFIAVLPPPPVNGLGTTGGFKLQIEDSGDKGYEALNDVTQQVVGKTYQNPILTGTYSGYKINLPQLEVTLDREKAKQLGLNVTDIFGAMQIYLGSLYVGDFNRFGRTLQVLVQADAPFRAHKDDIANLKIRNNKGDMVPLGSVVTVKDSYGPESVVRYNAFRAADINSGPAQGYSTGQAQKAMTEILSETLPKGFTYEWTELTYQQILAGNTMFLVFPLCVFLVFLVLAAQYESLTLPIAVIMIVPMCLLCAIFGVWITKNDNNIFTQIGFFVLAGLACKNAILIVEFARELEFQGYKIMQAALESARLRLRPILMTSFAFVFGVIPLVMASGAGAEMRHAMGLAVFSGMLGVTFFGIFLTPVFYVVVRYITGAKPLVGHHIEGTVIAAHHEAEASDEAH